MTQRKKGSGLVVHFALKNIPFFFNLLRLFFIKAYAASRKLQQSQNTEKRK
jgi:hypothetical protein